MSELTQNYRKIMSNIHLDKLAKRKEVKDLFSTKVPFTDPPRDTNYDRYGKDEAIRIWNKGFYPEIKLLYNERPKGDPNAFAKALVSNETVVVADPCIDNYAPRTRALSGAINRASKHGGDLLILGNLTNKKYRKRFDLVAEFINDLNVHKLFLILGPFDIYSCDDYIDFGFSYVTDRAEKRLGFTRLIYTYFPIPVKEGQLNIHGHPSDDMYHSMGYRNHFDASPIMGIKSMAVNTLGDILAEVSERDGKDI